MVQCNFGLFLKLGLSEACNATSQSHGTSQCKSERSEERDPFLEGSQRHIVGFRTEENFSAAGSAELCMSLNTSEVFFLLRAERDGTPTCVAILPTPDSRRQVAYGSRGFILGRADRISVVSFFCGSVSECSTDILLGLKKRSSGHLIC